MPDSFLSKSFHRLSRVARRDRLIQELRTQVEELERKSAPRPRQRGKSANPMRDAFVKRPSFQIRLHAERRLRALAEEMGAPSTSVIQHGKLYVYDLVRSHGIETPLELGRWEDPGDIAWNDLPELVTIKSAFAAASRGVLPLRRVGADWKVVTAAETMSTSQIVDSLRSAVDANTIRPPFVAEEFLDEDGTVSRLPTDTKVYAFYGEVPMIVLRRPVRFGEEAHETRFRVIDRHGQDIQGLEARSTIDPALAPPAALEGIVYAATRLSLALRTPFSRLDFYGIGDRVVFGEVTPRPGGPGWHGAVVDRMLGDAWERAQVRLERDIADGLAPEPQFGPGA